MPSRTSLDHVTIVTDSFQASRAVYDAVLGVLGLVPSIDYEDPEGEPEDPDTVAAVGYCDASGGLRVVLAAGPAATNNASLALATSDRAAVAGAFQAGLAAGAAPVQAPREWEAEQLNYYGAQLADPGGNIIEVVYRP